MSSPDRYTPPSYRGAIVMLIVMVIGIAFVWWAFFSVLDSDVYIPGLPPAATPVEEPAP